MTRQEELLKEIAEITSQYKAEVPGKRKGWPKAIQDRVSELHRLGMRPKAVADATGLSYFTVLNWKKRNGEFKELQLPSPEKAIATVTVPIEKKTSTVTVTAKGLRIKGLTFEQFLVALERLR